MSGVLCLQIQVVNDIVHFTHIVSTLIWQYTLLLPLHCQTPETKIVHFIHNSTVCIKLETPLYSLNPQLITICNAVYTYSLLPLKARTHRPIFKRFATESVVESADSLPESADSTTDFTKVGRLPLSNMFDILLVHPVGRRE